LPFSTHQPESPWPIGNFEGCECAAVLAINISGFSARHLGERRQAMQSYGTKCLNRSATTDRSSSGRNDPPTSCGQLQDGLHLRARTRPKLPRALSRDSSCVPVVGCRALLVSRVGRVATGKHHDVLSQARSLRRSALRQAFKIAVVVLQNIDHVRIKNCGPASEVNVRPWLHLTGAPAAVLPVAARASQAIPAEQDAGAGWEFPRLAGPSG